MKPVGRVLVGFVIGLASLQISLIARALRARSLWPRSQTYDFSAKRQRKQERETKPNKVEPTRIWPRNSKQEHETKPDNVSSERIWPQLQPELAELIAIFLPRNEIASLRLVNKAAAAQFSKSQHKIIKLGLPVPRHVFLHRWGGAHATYQLTLEERSKLLCLTAASGCLDNLNLLYNRAEFAVCTSEVFAAAALAGRLFVCRWLRRAGCPWGEDVAEVAARGGHLAICKWLIRQGCPHNLKRMLTLAAGEGHHELCEWLLGAGAPLSSHGPRAAARAGHAELMFRLLRPLHRQQVGVPKLLAAVAEGCDLPTLQRVYSAFVESRHGDIVVGVGRLGEAAAARVLAAAAGSSTPDWQAKVEWLRSRGYPRDASACENAVDVATPAETAPAPSQPWTTRSQPQPESHLGRERLVWLQQHHGFPVGPWVVCAAARRGDVTALRYLLHAGGVDLSDGRAAYTAAERGHLAVLQALYAHGVPMDAGELSEAAARGGHLTATAWLVEALAAPLSGRLLSAAAQSGSLELMAWLRRRGCPAEASTFAWASWVGSVEQLEWLAANGCPMGDDGEPYLWAGYNGDYAVLQCLRRLGCRWGADGGTFARAVCLAGDEEPGHSGDMGWCCSLEVLQWLLAEGCPVDWRLAERVARMRREDEDDLVKWVSEQRRLWEAGAKSGDGACASGGGGAPVGTAEAAQGPAAAGAVAPVAAVAPAALEAVALAPTGAANGLPM